MLVSSIGYFSAETKTAAAKSENGKNMIRPVVTQGLTEKNNKIYNNASIFQYLKNVEKTLRDTFSQDLKDMRNSLNMIA